MASPTFKLIESYTVPVGGIGSVTFGAGGTIPSMYTDLVLIASARDNRGTYTNSPAGITTVNGSAISSASVRHMFGNGSSVGSEGYSQAWSGQDGGTVNTSGLFAISTMYLANANGTVAKTLLQDAATESNGTTATQSLAASSFALSAAITSFVIAPLYASLFDAGSTFYLYGIKNS